MDIEFKHILEKKLSHDVGVLTYQYLNEIEPQIQNSLTALRLIQHYGLHTGRHANRCICPIHNGKNTSSFAFNDKEKGCHCFSCNFKGSYLEFIAKMQNFSNKNAINEAKIFAANHFAGMNLGFESITDFELKLHSMIEKRYKETGSLKLIDYFDISLIPDRYKNSNGLAHDIKNKPDSIKIIDIKYTLKTLDPQKEKIARDIEQIESQGITAYQNAISIASASLLIKDFTERSTLLNSTEDLYEFMGKKYNLTPVIVDKYGLKCFVKGNQKLLSYSDFFMLNNRVLFPYKDDLSGRIVGFQCRSIDPKITKEYKYLNISDYQKTLETSKNGVTFRNVVPFLIGNFIFNLFELKNKKIDTLWVTEGAADTMLLTQMGYDSVSPGQSNLTDEQIYLIYKYFSLDLRINLFFDNDRNSVGQNNSIKIAYRLYQFGFKNVHVIRSYEQIGKDLTDCYVKLKDEDLLNKLIMRWEKEAYHFLPASDDDLDKLLKTNLYSESDILKVDPREIKELIKFAEYINTAISPSEVSGEDLMKILRLHGCSIEALSKFCDKVKDKYAKTMEVVPQVLPTSPVVETPKVSSAVKPDDFNFNNLTSRQAYVLKQKYGIEIVKKIDSECNKNQVGSIISNIKRNVPFEIDDYLKGPRKDYYFAVSNPEKREYVKPSYVYEKDSSFKPIPNEDEDEDIPF